MGRGGLGVGYPHTIFQQRALGSPEVLNLSLALQAIIKEYLLR